jgi:benzylsuccinate CoA-transferase BbsF subunit
MVARVFDGLKVADFSWVGVGPITTKYLADHGATVVRVESATRPDVLRVIPPFKGGVPGLNRSQFFANYNTSKLGLALNLNTPEGREVAWRLIMWADVVAESFTPGTMKAWGLDYEAIARVRPDIIMISTCQQGQTGPHAHYAGFGQLASALGGYYEVTGWPDREPAGPYGAYTDFICPPFALAALVAALDYRRRTGKGQYLDLSQFECGLQFLGPALLDYAVNGRVATRAGNRDSQACPHGAFPCAGDDRWVAVAVTTDREWQEFCRVLGHPEWATDSRFATFLARRQNEDLLESLVAEATRTRDAYELMAALQAARVPAGVVQRCSDLHRDPQLAHRGHWVTLNHCEMGPTVYDGIPFRLSETPGRLERPAPCLGEHTEFVLKELLGYTDEEIAGLVIAGALE